MRPEKTSQAWILYLFLLTLSILAIGFSYMIYVTAPVGMYDFNVDLFKHVLTKPQQESINGMLQVFIIQATLPLALANVCWMIAAGISLMKRK